MIRARRPSLLLLALAGVACDKLYADPIAPPPPTTTSRADAGFVTPRAPAIPCPAQAAEENAPCTRSGAICEYGDSPDPGCNGTWICATDTSSTSTSRPLYWTEQTAADRCATCPPAAQIVDGAPCDVPSAGGVDAGDAGAADDAELHCTTPAGTCACTTGRDGAHAHARMWVCTKPAEGCPGARPMLGQVCLGERDCDYGQCTSKRGTRMVCRDEVWQIEAKPCE